MTNEELNQVILRKLDVLEVNITDQIGRLKKEVNTLRERVKLQDTELIRMRAEQNDRSSDKKPVRAVLTIKW